MRPSRCNWPRCRCRRWGGKVRRDIISVRTAPNIRNPKVAGLLVNQSRRGEEIRGAEIPDMGRITCIARCFSQPYLLTTCHPEGLQSQGAHSSAPFASVLSTFSPPRRYDAIPDFHISPPPLPYTCDMTSDTCGERINSEQSIFSKVPLSIGLELGNSASTNYLFFIR